MTTFNDPASGDFIDFKDVNGSLLLFVVYEETDEHTTIHGPNTAIIADIVVLDGDLAGTFYDHSYVYPRGLKPQLRKSVGGQMVLGRLGQSAAKPGMNPAWVLSAATDADKALAQKWVDSNGTPTEAAAQREAEFTKPF